MKKNQIIIITLVSILVLACVTFAIVYFATDTFKSEKQLFFEYSKQMNLKDFIDLESYNQYVERMQSQGHANDGEFNISISQNGTTVSEAVKYNGYTDPISKKSDYNISLTKDNEKMIAVNYLRSEDLYGILFEDIVNQYVVLENNNLKEFASNLGITDLNEIPNKIEISQLEQGVTLEDLSQIYSRYLNIAIENIPENNYYKIEKQDIELNEKTVKANGYAIDLDLKDIQTILVSILENAKEDEEIFNLIKTINNQMTFEQYKSSIDERLNEINVEIPDEENVNKLTITIYKQGKNAIKLSLNFKEETDNNIEISLGKDAYATILTFINTNTENEEITTMQIKKTENSEEQENFDVLISQKSGDENITTYDFSLSREGAFSSDNITYSLSIPVVLQEASLNISFKNTTNFSAAPEFKEFTEGNYLIINKVPREQLTNLFNNLGKLVAEKLQNEMFLSAINNGGIYQAAQQASQETQNQMNQEQSSMDALMLRTFNSQFETYEGIRGAAEIKTLITTINVSNATDTDHIVIYSGIEENAIDATKQYKVSFEKDSEGYINKVIVAE